MILTNLTNNHDRILYDRILYDTTLELLAIRRDQISNIIMIEYYMILLELTLFKSVD